MKKTNKEIFELVGEITVETGEIRVGDPLYSDLDINTRKYDVEVVPHDREGGNYDECGAAVLVMSGFGDGVYPVYIKRCKNTGVVKELRIKFL